MKIYNEEKTQILSNVDLNKGHLKNDRLLISNEEAEESHFEIKTYENGGTEKIKIIDKPYKPAEYEDIKIYIPYTNEYIINKRIEELKLLLAKTDYQAIKFAEGELSAEEYLPIKQKRRSYRAEINSLEEKLKNFA